MISFYLNKQFIETDHPPNMMALDFLRKQQHLSGTKESCRQGDCGTCRILLGHWHDGSVVYQSVNSCLLPLAEVVGRHVVTIEGLNQDDLNPIQRVLVEEGAIQCGFCSPGLIIALTGFFLHSPEIQTESAIAAADGLCRCTGYMAIKRGIALLCDAYPLKDTKDRRVEYLVEQQIVPGYFLEIASKLQNLDTTLSDITPASPPSIPVAGGTDLFISNPAKFIDSNLQFLSRQPDLTGIHFSEDRCHIRAATPFAALDTPEMIKIIPRFSHFLSVIGSNPIRERATVGGNIANASPCGDMIVILLGLGAVLILNNDGQRREIDLKDFFLGYKQLAKEEHEIIEEVYFTKPSANTLFDYDKVCQRAHLDIASVNTAIQLTVEAGIVQEMRFAAGGVGPTPLLLHKTNASMKGNKINTANIKYAAQIAQKEISPISDIRGSEEYKRLLLRQMFYGHFLTLFPNQLAPENFVSSQ